MKYILVTKNAKIVVSEEQMERFVKEYKESKSDLIKVKGQYINRYGLEIYEFDFFLKQEEDNLKPRGLRRCKRCAEILSRLDRCGCLDKPEKIKDNIFLQQTNQTIAIEAPK